MGNIGEQIKKLRKERGLTQKQLADALGLSKATIVSYEISKQAPNFEAVLKLEKFFHVSASYLNGDTDVNNFDFYQGTLLLQNEKLKKLYSDFCVKYEVMPLEYKTSAANAISSFYELFIFSLDKESIDNIDLIISQLQGCLKNIGSNENIETHFIDYPHAISQSVFKLCKSYHNFVRQKKV